MLIRQSQQDGLALTWLDLQRVVRGGFGANLIRIDREDASVDQFVFWLFSASAAVLSHQVVVRKRALRILVERTHIRMRRRGVEVEVVLLDIFAVVALISGDPEQPLLEDWIGLIP